MRDPILAPKNAAQIWATSQPASQTIILEYLHHLRKLMYAFYMPSGLEKRLSIKLTSDASQIAELYARSRAISLNDAINELIQSAQARKTPEFKIAANGLPVFPSRGRVLTSEMVKRYQDDEVE